ncbi:MAG TPA: hypothetical protein VLX61_14945 [Anaerolineales bacterium]|nr:hypothetical protein [Anaerolineales bacterium]
MKREELKMEARLKVVAPGVGSPMIRLSGRNSRSGIASNWKPNAWKPIPGPTKRSAREVEHNHAVVLKSLLEERIKN